MLSIREVMFVLWPLFAILKLMAKAAVKIAAWSVKVVAGGVRWVADRVAGSGEVRGNLEGGG